MGGNSIQVCVIALALSSLSSLAGCGTGAAVMDYAPDPGDDQPGGSGNDVSPPEPAAACGTAVKPDGDQLIKLTSGGIERSVLVHMPPGYDPKVAVPLVLAYPFIGSSPAAMSQLTGLDAAADGAGMLLAYPVGVSGSFNAGKCCGKAWEDGVDDVAFTRDMIDEIANTYCVDLQRVYATGMSNGAMMAYRVACELADRIAGIAPVAGALHTVEPCTPSRHVPLLAIHGTADTVIPFQGGVGQPPFPVSGDMSFSSFSDNVALFRDANGCGKDVKETYQQGDATCRMFTGCLGAADVELCTIDGGGHTWPGGSFPSILGKTSTDLNASEKVMKFFREHAGK